MVEFFPELGALALVNTIIVRFRRGGAPEGPSGVGNQGRDKVALASVHKDQMFKKSLKCHPHIMYIA